jgi:hypothetical protein
MNAPSKSTSKAGGSAAVAARAAAWAFRTPETINCFSKKSSSSARKETASSVSGKLLIVPHAVELETDVHCVVAVVFCP